MVRLSTDDLKKLVDILASLPILSTEKGREAVIISGGLQSLLPLVDLSGPSAVVIPLLINFFQSYGKLEYDQESLGRYINTIKEFMGGGDDANFLDYLLDKYQLMIPAISREPTKTENDIDIHDYNERIIDENTLKPISFEDQS